jgi:hypothetical protein
LYKVIRPRFGLLAVEPLGDTQGFIEVIDKAVAVDADLLRKPVTREWGAAEIHVARLAANGVVAEPNEIGRDRGHRQVWKTLHEDALGDHRDVVPVLV